MSVDNLVETDGIQIKDLVFEESARTKGVLLELSQKNIDALTSFTNNLLQKGKGEFSWEDLSHILVNTNILLPHFSRVNLTQTSLLDIFNGIQAEDDNFEKQAFLLSQLALISPSLVRNNQYGYDYQDALKRLAHDASAMPKLMYSAYTKLFLGADGVNVSPAEYERFRLSLIEYEMALTLTRGDKIAGADLTGYFGSLSYLRILNEEEFQKYSIHPGVLNKALEMFDSYDLSTLEGDDMKDALRFLGKTTLVTAPKIQLTEKGIEIQRTPEFAPEQPLPVARNF